MQKSYTVAVVGATGVVGREILQVLSDRKFPVKKIIPLASERSAGETVECHGQEFRVQKTTAESFQGVDIALMSPGAKASAEFAPMAAKAGAIVIDNSSHFRMEEDIPLVIPEVNPEDIGLYKKRGIIANPNCSTIQMLVALAPLHKNAQLKRIIVSTYQAVSGAGKKLVDELSEQVTMLFNGRDVTPKVLPKRIAFNCVPHIDVFQEGGFTKEENKMKNESRKIMHLPDLAVCATCVRVPVFTSHSESVVAEFEKPMTPEIARRIWREAPGVVLMDDPQTLSYPTPIDAAGTDATYIGRVRQDPSASNSLAFWCVADNLRKGAAANAVQIAEILARDYLSK